MIDSRRSVSPVFIEAMEKGLDRGRLLGRRGWDTHWELFLYREIRDILLLKFQEEVAELVLAVIGRQGHVLDEAADVANLAMMLADVCEGLAEETGGLPRAGGISR